MRSVVQFMFWTNSCRKISGVSIPPAFPYVLLRMYVCVWVHLYVSIYKHGYIKPGKTILGCWLHHMEHPKTSSCCQSVQKRTDGMKQEILIRIFKHMFPWKIYLKEYFTFADYKNNFIMTHIYNLFPTFMQSIYNIYEILWC